MRVRGKSSVLEEVAVLFFFFLVPTSAHQRGGNLWDDPNSPSSYHWNKPFSNSCGCLSTLTCKDIYDQPRLFLFKVKRLKNMRRTVITDTVIYHFNPFNELLEVWLSFQLFIMWQTKTRAGNDYFYICQAVCRSCKTDWSLTILMTHTGGWGFKILWYRNFTSLLDYNSVFFFLLVISYF